ncbi:ATP-binding cassette domain-containing protein [Micromonospora sp. SD12]|uniref:ATP-binding cassette domain-containing protein n=1 Tax=Micromonospora sp. SD12 TaxID=3452216 RepID=UPI003F893344
MSVVLADVSQGYGTSNVIDQLSLTLSPGVTALVGPNGAGKSTLLRTLATVMPPRSGTVAIDGVEVRDEKSARAVRNGIGYLPQHFGCDPQMNVWDFVAYGAWLRGVPARAAGQAIEHVLGLVDLADRRRDRMGRLSGGMRQRAGVAWAIVGGPRLVLLDEPTVGLDPRQRLHFRGIIGGLRDTIVVLSTHLIDDVAAICDRVVVVNGGAVQFEGPVSELEVMGREDLPGHSPLERAYMRLMPAEEQRL